MQFFWSVFFRIGTEYRDLRNVDSECGHFLRSEKALIAAWMVLIGCMIAVRVTRVGQGGGHATIR